MKDFIAQAERIVAAHKAQYKGVYYMKGGGLFGKIAPILGGLAGTLIPGVGPILGPAIGSALGGAVSGGGVKGSLIDAATAGAGAGLSGIAGDAFSSAFPETAGAISSGVSDITSPVTSLFSGGGGTPGGFFDFNSAGGIPSNVSGDFGSGLTGDFGNAVGAGASGFTPSESGGSFSLSDPTSGLVHAQSGTPDLTSALSSGNSLSSILSSGTDTVTNFTPASADFIASSGAGGGGVAPGTVGSDILDVFDPEKAATGGGFTDFGNASSSGANSLKDITGLENASPVAANAATTGGPESSFMSAIHNPSLNNILKAAGNNSGLLLGGAGLGLDAISQGRMVKGQRQVQGEAGQLAGQGKQLSSYLQSGTLPPGVQQSIDQATNSAKASIRSQYAARGMSGSSAEQQDLAAVDTNSKVQGAQIAMNLLQTGIQETGLASGLYENLMKMSMDKDKGLAEALAAFGAASSGGGGSSHGGVNINLGGSA